MKNELNSKSKILRELIKTKPIVKIAGAYDGMSAYLVEKAGFDAVWGSSFAMSASRAIPDGSFMTRDELLQVANYMEDTCKRIPIILDCDTGYGDYRHINLIVNKCEKIRIAGICIEDQKFPKQNSLIKNSKPKLETIEEFVKKIKSAINSKKNDSFIVIARIESLIAKKGIEDAIERANEYEKAGTDAILIQSKKNMPDEIFEFTKKWNGTIPIIVVPTTYPSVTIDELIEHNIKMVIYANQTIRAAHSAIIKVLSHMINCSSLNEINKKISPNEDIFKIQESRFIDEPQ